MIREQKVKAEREPKRMQIEGLLKASVQMASKSVRKSRTGDVCAKLHG